MKLIAAPARVFKTWSMLLLMAAGVFDLAVVLVKALSDLHVMSTETFGAINAVLVFLVGASRFIQQQIKLTTEQKIDVLETVSEMPVREGQAEVTTTITQEPKG